MEQRTSFRKAWSVVYPILLYYVINYLVVLLLAMLTQAVGGIYQGVFATTIRNHSASLSAGMKGIGMLAGMVASIPAWKQENGTKPPLAAFGKREDTTGLDRGRKIKKLLIGSFMGIVTALFLNSLFTLLHVTESSQTFDSVAAVQFSVPFFLGIVLYGVVAPLSEEVLFRGIVFRRMKRLYSVPIALIGSAIFFGAFHGNLVQAIYGTIMGLFLACLYEISGDFLMPLCFHSGANLAVFITVSIELCKLYVFSVSGCIVLGVLLIIISLLTWKYKIFK